MIEFTKVSRSLFRKSKKFRPLDDHCRLLYLYLLVTEHINSAGCYQLSEGYAVTDLGWDVERFANRMQTLCEAQLITWDRGSETVLIENWVAFNEPSNARHAIGILNQLSDVDSEQLKAKRFTELRASICSKKLFNEKIVGADLERLVQSFAYPSDTLAAQKNETEKEIERETKNKKESENQTETREESRVPRPVAAPERGDGPAAQDTRPAVSTLLNTGFIQSGSTLDIPRFLDRRRQRA